MTITLPDDPVSAVRLVRSIKDDKEADAAERALRKKFPDQLFPQRGMQWQVANCKASIIILGGAASAGKTWYALFHPLQFLDVPDYNCTFVRRDSEETTLPGGLWDEASAMWGSLPRNIHCRANKLDAVWPKPRKGGMPISWRCKFVHVHDENPAKVEKKKGMQTCDLIIEEGTGFAEETVIYLLSRNRPRASCPKSPQCIITTNPDRDSWLFRYVRPWVDAESPLYPTAIGEELEMRRWDNQKIDPPGLVQRHLVHKDGPLCWLRGYNEEVRRLNRDLPDDEQIAIAKTVTYIEGSVYQNKVLLSTDAGRENLAGLESQNEVQRERLLHSNWLIRDTDKSTFLRDWFEVVDDPPGRLVQTVRSWDYSVRRKYTRSRTRPDFTVGLKIARMSTRKDGRPCYIILDVWRQRCTPAETEDATKELAAKDGKDVAIVQQTTHGDEGIRAVSMTQRYVVPGYKVHGVQLKGDKEDRAFHLSTAAQQGRVYLLRAPWNAEFLTEAANFPNGRYDDQIDAASVGVQFLRDARKGKTMVAEAATWDGIRRY